MSELALQPPRTTFPYDTALDTAAETLSGLTLLDAADMAWARLTALAEGDRSDKTIHHRAIVLLALSSLASPGSHAGSPSKNWISNWT